MEWESLSWSAYFLTPNLDRSLYWARSNVKAFIPAWIFWTFQKTFWTGQFVVRMVCCHLQPMTTRPVREHILTAWFCAVSLWLFFRRRFCPFIVPGIHVLIWGLSYSIPMCEALWSVLSCVLTRIYCNVVCLYIHHGLLCTAFSIWISSPIVLWICSIYGPTGKFQDNYQRLNAALIELQQRPKLPVKFTPVHHFT